VDGAHTLHSVPTPQRTIDCHEILSFCVHQVMSGCHHPKGGQDSRGASAISILPDSRIPLLSDSRTSETEAKIAPADSGLVLI